MQMCVFDAYLDMRVVLTAVLFPRHTSASARENTINLIHTLRNYLHYHIKCSKVLCIRSSASSFSRL